MIDESYESRIGKKPNQKLKAYLIMKYLLEHADDAHAVSAETIVEYLQDTLGIYAVLFIETSTISIKLFL